MTDVCIAEGHGRRDDGTHDPGAQDGVHNEQRDSKPVARACTDFLRANGLDVASESDMADDPNYPGTIRWERRLRPRCIVSFHYDWSGAPAGAFSIQTTDEGRRLGWAIEARVAEAGFDIRPYPDDRDNLALLNGTTSPAVIFECGRIGHEDIDETHEQEAMGRAAALGIMDFLGVSPHEEELIMTPGDESKIRDIVRAELARATGDSAGVEDAAVRANRRAVKEREVRSDIAGVVWGQTTSNPRPQHDVQSSYGGYLRSTYRDAGLLLTGQRDLLNAVNALRDAVKALQ